MVEMRKLNEGEQYITVSLGGAQGIQVALFPATSKDGKKYYRGSIPVVAFVNKKKASQGQVTEEIIG